MDRHDSRRPFATSASWRRKKGIAENGRLVLSLGAVRGRGGLASEPRQALIGATVVCPHLPRFPGGTFFAQPLEPIIS